MSKAINRIKRKKRKSSTINFPSKATIKRNKLVRTKNAITKLRNKKATLQTKLNSMGKATPYSPLAKEKAKIRNEIKTLQQQINKYVQEKKTPRQVQKQQQQKVLKQQLKQQKIEEEKRRQQYIDSEYKKYNITKLTPQQIKDLPEDKRQLYLERETKILTGQYQRERAEQWLDNYYDRLVYLGYKGLADLFLEFVTENNADLLSSLLPKIQLWYDDGSDAISDKIHETAMEFIEVMERTFPQTTESEKIQLEIKDGKIIGVYDKDGELNKLERNDPTIVASKLPRKVK